MHTLPLLQTIFDHAHAPERVTEQHVEVALHEWKTRQDQETAEEEAKEEAFQIRHARPRAEAERAYQAYTELLATSKPSAKRATVASMREWIANMKDLGSKEFSGLRDLLYTRAHAQPVLPPAPVETADPSEEEAQAFEGGDRIEEDVEDKMEEKETHVEE